MALLIVPMMENLRVYFLGVHLDKMMDVSWVFHMVLLMNFVRYQHVSILGLDDRVTIGIDDVSEMGYSYGSSDVSNNIKQRVPCLVFHLN